jgi:predicted transcriptional regulator
MTELTVDIPDDQFARLRSHLDKHDGDLAQFISEAIDDRLARQDDPVIQAQVDAQIKQSVAEFERGEGVDARQAMREIADEFGIKLNR